MSITAPLGSVLRTDRPAAGPIELTAVEDLDLVTETRVRRELHAALGDGHDIVVDAAAVFVDARGLSVLLDAAREATERGQRFSVRAPRCLQRMCVVLMIGDRLPLVEPRPSAECRTDLRHAG